MDLLITRDLNSPDCTLGTVPVGSAVFQTLELPWVPAPPSLGGHPNLSCIPAGTYSLVRHDTQDHPRSFALVNESLGVYHNARDIPLGQTGRTDVLLHTGNVPADSRGCLLVGKTRTKIGDQMAIGYSRDAYEALMALLPWIDGMHQIVIEYAPGVSPP